MAYKKKMAYRKKFKRPYPKKRRVPRLRLGTPYKIVRKLRYDSDNLILDPGVNTVAARVFSWNGMYDPYVTGVGAQPRYFDQYVGVTDGTGMYKNYVVLGARVRVTFMNRDSGLYSRVGLTTRNDPTPTLSATSYIEDSGTGNTYKYLSPQGSGGSKCTIYKNWSAKKWFGKPNVTTEKDLEGNAGANPSKQQYLHVWAANAGTSDPGNTLIEVQIDYVVMFRNPMLVGQS